MAKRVLNWMLIIVLLCTMLPNASATEYVVTQVIPCKYESAEQFNNGVAWVEQGGKWGLVDTEGKELTPFQYDKISALSSDDLFRVGINTGRMRENPWTVPTPIYLYGFVDRTGREVIPCQYEESPGCSFSEGLVTVSLMINEDSLQYGVFDTAGREIVPIGKYKSIGPFSEGLAQVTDSGGLRGYIDKTGQEVIPCQFIDATEFREGLALVKKDIREKQDVWDMTQQKWGIIDQTGKFIVPCHMDYVHAEAFDNGLAAVSVRMKDMTGWEQNWGFIDKNGKEVIACKYHTDGLFPPEIGEDGLIGAYDESNKWGYIDTNHRTVVPFVYARGDYAFSEGMAGVMDKNYKNGFVDENGREAIPCVYDGAKGFSEGLAAVLKGDYSTGKWGFVDKTGEEIIPCQYAFAKSFSNGFAAVQLGEKWGFIDQSGKIAVPFEYGHADHFCEGLAAVEQDGKWGFISSNTTTEPVVKTAVAYPSTQTVEVDGRAVEFQCYALKDEAGNDTNYIKLRDLADILNGSAAQFQVGWDNGVTITTGTAYTPNGSEQNTPFSGQREYQELTTQTRVDGQTMALAAFALTDDNGGGYTYYRLRDLGEALNFKVDWSADRGIFIETK